MNGVAGDDPVTAQGDPGPHSGGHEQTQGPLAETALADLLGLRRHGDQGRLGHGGGEADQKGEGVDRRPSRPLRKLERHGLSQREQAQVQPQYEGIQPQDDHGEAADHPVGVGERLPYGEVLAPEDDQDDGEDVPEDP